MTVPRWLKSPRWLVLLAGALPVLAFPAPDLGFAAWFALVPGLLLIVRAQTARESGIRGWWFGTGYLTAAWYWLAPEVGPAVLLVAVVFGVFFIPLGVAAWSLLRPPPPALAPAWPARGAAPVSLARALAALVLVPSCWLLTEWLRSWQALGGPWGVYGTSQWRHPAVLALASVGGVWLVSFALVAANVAITIAILVLTSSARDTRFSAAGLAAVAALILVAGAGPLVFALTAPFPVVRQATIVLVQPGVVNDPGLSSHASQALNERWNPGSTRPDLIVWGESSIDQDLTLSSAAALRGQIQALAGRDGADILVSQDATPPGKGHEKWAVLVSRAGLKGIYVKTRLVPFGEYIPFRQQLGWLTKVSRAASSNMIPGTGAHLLYPDDRAGKPLPIGVLVCFESAFADMSRVDAGNGAQLLVYQSSTTTFQGTWGPDQHASLAAVRAAETGRPAVQAALTGDSVAFDARGRLLAWMGQSDSGVVTVRLGLPAASSLTLYDRWGDYVPWTAMAIVVLAAVVMLGRRRGFLRSPAGAGGGRTAQYEPGQSVPS